MSIFFMVYMADVTRVTFSGSGPLIMSRNAMGTICQDSDTNAHGAGLSPNALRHIEESLTALGDLGLSPRDTVDVLTAVDKFVLGTRPSSAAWNGCWTASPPIRNPEARTPSTTSATLISRQRHPFSLEL